MDPLSAATATVGLLVALFKLTADKFAERAGEMIADAALPKVKALSERVRAKLGPDNYQGALLEGVEAEPDDLGRQESLKAELTKMLSQDKAFAADVERLLGEAQQAGLQIKVTDAGVVAGRDAKLRGRYVAGRDLIVGRTPDDR